MLGRHLMAHLTLHRICRRRYSREATQALTQAQQQQQPSPTLTAGSTTALDGRAAASTAVGGTGTELSSLPEGTSMSLPPEDGRSQAAARQARHGKPDSRSASPKFAVTSADGTCVSLADRQHGAIAHRPSSSSEVHTTTSNPLHASQHVQLVQQNPLQPPQPRRLHAPLQHTADDWVP